MSGLFSLRSCYLAKNLASYVTQHDHVWEKKFVVTAPPNLIAAIMDLAKIDTFPGFSAGGIGKI